MKTYKQRYKEQSNEYRKLSNAYNKVSEENRQRAEAINKNHLFDPIEYVSIHKKLSKTVDALESIKNLEMIDRLQTSKPETRTIVEIICDDVLLKLFGPLGKI